MRFYVAIIDSFGEHKSKTIFDQLIMLLLLLYIWCGVYTIHICLCLYVFILCSKNRIELWEFMLKLNNQIRFVHFQRIYNYIRIEKIFIICIMKTYNTNIQCTLYRVHFTRKCLYHWSATVFPVARNNKKKILNLIVLTITM